MEEEIRRGGIVIHKNSDDNFNYLEDNQNIKKEIKTLITRLTNLETQFEKVKDTIKDLRGIIKNV